MIIVGAKGFAKEVLEVLHQLGQTENLVFFDNVSNDLPEKLFGQFDILRTELEVKNFMTTYGNQFALGLGNPKSREKLTLLMESWGGELTSVISSQAQIGQFGVSIQTGATILAGAIITSSAKIGKGLLMYPNSIITHDCEIEDFVELSPGATLLGGCHVGKSTHLGANCTVLPNLTIGHNCVVGAGSVVTKTIPDNQVVKGIPAK